MTSEFRDCFESYEHYAFRLETLEEYSIETEMPTVQRYLDGHPTNPKDEPGFQSSWYDNMRNKVAAGKSFQVVHTVQGPLSGYLRYECEWGYAWNTENLGQEVGIIDTAEVAWPTGLHKEDFWLFDDRTVIRMHYDQAGHFLHPEFLPDPEVPQYVEYRRIALSAATPFTEYWAAHPEYHRESWLGTAGR